MFWTIFKAWLLYIYLFLTHSIRSLIVIKLAFKVHYPLDWGSLSVIKSNSTTVTLQKNFANLTHPQ